MAGGFESGTGVRGSAASYAALVRVPNLFTAPPDVLLGAALAAAAGMVIDPTALVGLSIASTFLYAGGTTLNDAFDAPADAVERPERPIPSGRVSREAGFALGVGLLVGGTVVAAVAAGRRGGAVAVALALTILLYDGALNGTGVGFLAMGATRGLNASLGTTAAGVFPTALPAAALIVPVVITAYIAAVTFMAAGETVGGDRTPIAVAGGGVVLAAATVGWRLALVRPGAVASGLALALVLLFLGWTGRALRRAYADPVPERIGPAVGTCVLALVVLDGAFAAATGILWGLGAVAFLVPALGLSRAFDVT